ncbi:polyprenol monophosphomannose synthase [bacterium]|nr:polyprenol monophosphomannose synthase [bacterium]
MSALSVTLVTPTYNERENIPLLVEEIFSALDPEKDIDLELVVVDDNSPDGTGEVAESLTDRYPLRVIHRAGKQGLGSAVMEGWRSSHRDLIGVMDADLSHDPVILAKLIRNLEHVDISIGSRYDPESRVEKWPWYRKVISQSGVFLAKQLTGVQDPLAGFFFLHRRVIDGVELTSSGYKILLEILVKGRWDKYSETPFIFRNREYSSSKLNVKEYYLFLKQLYVFSILKLRG